MISGDEERDFWEKCYLLRLQEPGVSTELAACRAANDLATWKKRWSKLAPATQEPLSRVCGNCVHTDESTGGDRFGALHPLMKCTSIAAGTCWATSGPPGLASTPSDD